MEIIIQGSNDPLLLAVEDLDKLIDISAVLVQYDKIKKEWTKDNAIIQGGILILPLSQEDTLKLTRGMATLDIKAYNQDKHVVFMDLVEYKVITRLNTNTFTEA